MSTVWWEPRGDMGTCLSPLGALPSRDPSPARHREGDVDPKPSETACFWSPRLLFQVKACETLSSPLASVPSYSSCSPSTARLTAAPAPLPSAAFRLPNNTAALRPGT